MLTENATVSEAHLKMAVKLGDKEWLIPRDQFTLSDTKCLLIFASHPREIITTNELSRQWLNLDNSENLVTQYIATHIARIRETLDSQQIPTNFRIYTALDSSAYFLAPKYEKDTIVAPRGYRKTPDWVFSSDETVSMVYPVIATAHRLLIRGNEHKDEGWNLNNASPLIPEAAYTTLVGLCYKWARENTDMKPNPPDKPEVIKTNLKRSESNAIRKFLKKFVPNWQLVRPSRYENFHLKMTDNYLQPPTLDDKTFAEFQAVFTNTPTKAENIPARMENLQTTSPTIKNKEGAPDMSVLQTEIALQIQLATRLLYSHYIEPQNRKMVRHYLDKSIKEIYLYAHLRDQTGTHHIHDKTYRDLLNQWLVATKKSAAKNINIPILNHYLQENGHSLNSKIKLRQFDNYLRNQNWKEVL